MTTIPASFDENRPFLPVQIAVLTVSDTRTPETDTSGDRLQALIEAVPIPHGKREQRRQ